MPDTDFSPVDLVRLVICAPLRHEPRTTHFPVELLRCYQALTASGGPQGQLPGIRLHSVPAVFPPAAAAGLSPEDGAAIDAMMSEAEWLLLVIGESAESRALATAIGAHVKSRGRDVMAFMPEDPSLPPAERAALLAAMGFLCKCPPSLPPLLAAEVIWSSVMCQGVVGIDYGDLRNNLTGEGCLLWAPLRQEGPERMRAMLSQLDDFRGRHTLWAVMVMPETCTLADFTEVGDHLSQHCEADCAVVIALPNTDALPSGLYVFVC
ncbi:MAG: hypothetical protein K0Q68_302 [Moraxellaceae bacterium]|jgi:hypothetical protein|nr:hypothetical protein [Moraxellaceae bacterium]